MGEDSRKLFVAGLSDSITEDVLRQLFEATGGSVLEVRLPKDRATHQLRGFGFVTMASDHEAVVARTVLHNTVQGGQAIKVRPFSSEPPKNSKPAASPDQTLYVGNLPYDVTTEEITALFSSHGEVVLVHLPVDDQTGRRRGFGFVTMGSATAARGAVDVLQAASVRGRRLVVNLARPRDAAPGGVTLNGAHTNGHPRVRANGFTNGSVPNGGPGRSGHTNDRASNGSPSRPDGRRHDDARRSGVVIEESRRSKAVAGRRKEQDRQKLGEDWDD